MSHSFLRLRQPAITRVNPHAGNRRFIIPNRLGQATTTLLEGLISQTDVNVDGRTDDAPFDHILGGVGTLINAPTLTVGDGGYDAMVFKTASLQAVRLAAPVFDFSRPFTAASRSKTSDAIADNAIVGIALDASTQPLIALKITRDAAGNSEAFNRDNAGGQTFVAGTIGGNADGVEHMVAMRSLGDGTGRVQLILDTAVAGDVTAGFVGATSVDNQSWGAFDTGGALGAFATADVSWVAFWDRLLTNDELIGLSAQPNPFGRAP